VDNDSQQDLKMDTACFAVFPNSEAATTDAIASKLYGIPLTNICQQEFLLGKCPNCEGKSNSSLPSNHSRKCVVAGFSIPTNVSSWRDDCIQSDSCAYCLGEFARISSTK
jgi:hypothetical protein